MRKRTAIVVLFALLLTASAGLAEEDAVVKPAGKGEWRLYGANGQLMGAIRKTPDGKTALVSKSGAYIGVLGPDGELYMTGRHSTMTPDMARLYLEAVKALSTLK